MSEGTALITGATGFIGTHLCRHLQERTSRLRALVRDSSAPVAPGIETIRVRDLRDRVALRVALQDVETVIHLAARVHVLRDGAADPAAEYRRVNVEGTRVLLEEAAAAGAHRFVLLSSVKVVGDRTAPGERWAEERTPAPVDPYGWSKLEAERLVHALAARYGMCATILRLPLVYGPGVRANMLRLFDLVARGVPLPLAGIDNRRSVAYVGNVCGAIEAVLARSCPGAEVFFVSDGRDVSTPELVLEIGRALGRPARLLPFPRSLLRIAARFGDRAVRHVPFPLTSRILDRLEGSLAVNASRLTRVTGYVPVVPLEAGLAATASWFRAREAA